MHRRFHPVLSALVGVIVTLVVAYGCRIQDPAIRSPNPQYSIETTPQGDQLKSLQSGFGRCRVFITDGWEWTSETGVGWVNATRSIGGTTWIGAEPPIGKDQSTARGRSWISESTSTEEFHYGWPLAAVWAGRRTQHGLQGPFEQTDFLGWSVQRAGAPDEVPFPMRINPVGFIVDSALYAIVSSLIFLGLSQCRRSARRQRQRCTECGYPRRGLSAAAFCPECGEPSPSSVVRNLDRRLV